MSFLLKELMTVFFIIFSSFMIPELPAGQHLVFHILSTWGDKHYVGLNGLEIFTMEGPQVAVKNVS